ncbi:MAG: hypothetical protein K0Q55_1470 [Verrucomicrobia bacterium]|jgi:hypothetical protein|nr:hypothetical protein [Verrucomicrobiota bacterium]
MNPFVNPHQRGIDLPLGCKDLIDVLKTPASSPSRQLLLPGTDASYFEAPLHRFYELKGMAILVPQKAVINLLNRPDSSLAFFAFAPSEISLKPAVHSFFNSREISSLIIGHSLIGYPLPVSAPKAAAIISQLLQQVFAHTGPVNLVMIP